MTLIDAGIENGMEFGHTDYKTGGGRFISSENHNEKERYINPELTTSERDRISQRDSYKRNCHQIFLYTKNNINIRCVVSYNPITEALSLTTQIFPTTGKKLLFLGYNKPKNLLGKCRNAISLLCENNCRVMEDIGFNPLTEELSFSTTIQPYTGKKLLRLN
jgi:hypothetical protein